MDLQAIVAQLADIGGYTAERQIANDLLEISCDETVPAHQREAHLHGALASRSFQILGLPWGRLLSPDVAAYIARLGGGRTIPDMVLTLVGTGCGVTASAPAMHRGLWVPEWIYREATARCGAEAVSGLADRIVIPPGWPVPTRQVLVRGFTDLGALEMVYQLLDLRPSVVVGELIYPTEWIAGAPSNPARGGREDLMAFAELDPSSAFRSFLAASGNPLMAIAHELAIAAIHESAQRAAGNALWNGRFSATGTQVVNYGGRVLLTAGWLLVVLKQLGFTCIGVTPAETSAAEEGLISGYGGAIAEGAAGRFCILPEGPSELVFGTKIDWSGVHAA